MGSCSILVHLRVHPRRSASHARLVQSTVVGTPNDPIRDFNRTGAPAFLPWCWRQAVRPVFGASGTYCWLVRLCGSQTSGTTGACTRTVFGAKFRRNRAACRKRWSQEEAVSAISALFVVDSVFYFTRVHSLRGCLTHFPERFVSPAHL